MSPPESGYGLYADMPVDVVDDRPVSARRVSQRIWLVGMVVASRQGALDDRALLGLGAHEPAPV